jgi:hypothetical protein
MVMKTAIENEGRRTDGTRTLGGRWLRRVSTIVGLVALLGVFSGPALAQAPVLPEPAYENSLQIGYFCLNNCYSSMEKMQQQANLLRSRVGEGPYVKLGIFYYSNVGMSWPLPADPTTATLSPTVESSLRTMLDRAEAADIGFHVSGIFGVTRVVSLYGPAVTEDRRNAQWLSTGAKSWVTTSRYARRLRAHLETKVRLYAQLFARLRQEYPETLLTLAADGEIELSDAGYDDNKPYEQQVLADYSPFAVAEFRDWIRNTGLYGPGGPFEGQGRTASGTKYRTGDDAADLAAFNADFGVGFGTWQLQYFDWDLADSVNADPNAIGPAEVADPGFLPLPTSGPRYIPGGFDAPRTWNAGSPAFWQLWLQFRETLVANYVRDVSEWLVSTTTPEGWSLPPDRVYTYQIPSDYYLGTYPGCPNPERRYLTSASTFDSADVGSTASLGVTVFDAYYWDGTRNYYKATSEYLFPEIARRRPWNWGLIESNLSWPISAVETDPAVVAARIDRAWTAGMHLYAYFPWPLDPNEEQTVLLDGLGLFARNVWTEPYDAALRHYAPAVVRGLASELTGKDVRFTWTPAIFASHPGFQWLSWKDFLRFEIVRAGAPDAPAGSWTLVKSVSNAYVTTLPVSSLNGAATWYRIRAVSKNGLTGEMSVPIEVPCPRPVVESLSITPSVVKAGKGATIAWAVSGATGATLAGQTAALPSGTKAVAPSTTTSYLFRATNPCGATEQKVTLNVLPATGGVNLSAPVITVPGAGQVLGVAGVSFAWNAVAGATGYDLRLWSATTGATVFTGSLLGNSSTATLLTLPNGSYTFGVRACSAGLFSDAKCGAFATRSFSVSLISPTGAPTIVAPAQGAALASSTQALSWTEVAPADPGLGLTYEVLLVDEAAGGLPELQINVPHPTLSTIYTLHGSSEYLLKVRACQAGCGPWSAPVSFSVFLPAVPATRPTITSAVVTGGNSLAATWTSVPGADFYSIYVIQPTGGPGGGALTVAARLVSETNVTFPVPAGTANIIVAACNGDGCGPWSVDATIHPEGPNPPAPNLGSPLGGSIVGGPDVQFAWNRIAGDDGTNTTYRLYVQDLSRQAAALDVYTTGNFWTARFKAEGARYDALVIASPGPDQVVGPPQGFNVRGISSSAPTMVSPAHQGRVPAGNVQLGWTPVPGAGLYQYYIAVLGQPAPAVTGVTPGLVVQVPLGTVGGAETLYSGITRACLAGTSCVASSDAGWGPWSNAPGGPGVTNFTVTP